MTDRELLQMALDALNNFDKGNHGMRWQVPIIKALRSRLANEFNPDWNQVEALQESLREHMAEIQRLRAALAQPEQEPVAWKDAPSKIYLQVCEDVDCDLSFDAHDEVSWCQDKINDSDIPYVRADFATPEREWQGLTDEDYEAMAEKCVTNCYFDTLKYARAIEARLRDKNS